MTGKLSPESSSSPATISSFLSGLTYLSGISGPKFAARACTLSTFKDPPNLPNPNFSSMKLCLSVPVLSSKCQFNKLQPVLPRHGI
ncbi:hypothetical protein IEQ34_014590 [Dendrobium chrysotoxum]|uniref:Uncharacterized protein n=1 Tax=Dendrobium chrysotoxum TaxID=161865 RepID=A0AAV7GM28_DENCH|nr:hypothetical protein IEQ34_014590 [Dendrobium chrysotoxum]